MEKFAYSSTHPLPSFSSAAESGWSAYLDEPSDDAYSFATTSSLLSDAASHAAAYKLSADPDCLTIPRKLTLKPKQAQLFVETSLEDTASSPDNSPKVSDLGPFDGNYYRRKSSLGNGRRMGDDERNLEMGFERKATEYTELNKRGLCLVPLSMLANYLA